MLELMGVAWARGQERLPCVMSHGESLTIGAGVGPVNSSRALSEHVWRALPGAGGGTIDKQDPEVWRGHVVPDAFHSQDQRHPQDVCVRVCTVGLFHGGCEL